MNHYFNSVNLRKPSFPPFFRLHSALHNDRAGSNFLCPIPTSVAHGSGSAVVFSGGAGGRLLRCVIGDTPQHGVHVSVAAKPVLEDCEV